MSITQTLHAGKAIKVFVPLYIAKKRVSMWSHFFVTLLLFLIITLDSPILDRVTAIQLPREASNSPSPTLYEQCVGSLTSHRIYVGKGWETGPSPFIALIREN